MIQTETLPNNVIPFPERHLDIRQIKRIVWPRNNCDF